jgi:rubrerythrin
MVSESTIEAIKTALQNEEKSVELYEESAEDTMTPIAKKTMLFLAGWEKQHITRIKQFQEYATGKTDTLDIDTMSSENPVKVVRGFFDMNMDDFKEKIKGTDNDLKLYETAMEIEKAGYDFYKKAAEETDDEKAKQLFEWLAKEENTHFEFLQDQHSYLSDPLSWNLDEERWIMEG